MPPQADPNRPLARIRALNVGESTAFTKRIPLSSINFGDEVTAEMRKLRDLHTQSISRATVIDEKYKSETGYFMSRDFQFVIIVLNVWRVE